jgi:hypothetical protein
VLPSVTLHPKLGSVVGLQVVAANLSVLASQCTQCQNDLYWVLRLGQPVLLSRTVETPFLQMEGEAAFGYGSYQKMGMC